MSLDVHPERALDGRDRAQLERLCRDLTRPPLAHERLDRGKLSTVWMSSPRTTSRRIEASAHVASGMPSACAQRFLVTVEELVA